MSEIIEKKEVLIIDWSKMKVGDSVYFDDRNRVSDANLWAKRKGNGWKFHGHLLRPGMEDFVEGERKFKITRTK